ncbi:MAG: hypothetical protein ABW123_26215, partial [Cystobacter sp.]
IKMVVAGVGLLALLVALVDVALETTEPMPGASQPDSESSSPPSPSWWSRPRPSSGKGASAPDPGWYFSGDER